MVMAILGIVGTLLTIFLFWLQGSDKRKKAQVWADFKNVEAAYRKALALGDSKRASILGKQMQEMRDKYKFLGE